LLYNNSQLLEESTKYKNSGEIIKFTHNGFPRVIFKDWAALARPAGNAERTYFYQ